MEKKNGNTKCTKNSEEMEIMTPRKNKNWNRMGTRRKQSEGEN
jgi:hypothetical protein